jgi:hypothetical protein
MVLRRITCGRLRVTHAEAMGCDEPQTERKERLRGKPDKSAKNGATEMHDSSLESL